MLSKDLVTGTVEVVQEVELDKTGFAPMKKQRKTYKLEVSNNKKALDATKDSNYIAPLKEGFQYRGIDMDAYLTEEGRPVLSERSAERGLGLSAGSIKSWRKSTGRVDDDHNYMRAQVHDGRDGLTIKAIRIITFAEYSEFVEYHNKKGNVIAESLSLSNMALELQRAWDYFNNSTREESVYQKAGARLFEELKQKRQALRDVSRELTNRLFGAGVYKPNNALAFDGKTRDTYQEDDLVVRLETAAALEWMQNGMRLANPQMSAKEIKAMSYKVMGLEQ